MGLKTNYQREQHETETLKSLQPGLVHKHIFTLTINPRPKNNDWLVHF